MAQGFVRTRFTSSGLVRVLADLAVAGAAEPRQSFAERLAEWLDFNDALSLFSALNPGAAQGAEPGRPGLSPEGRAARQAFARVRAALTESIRTAGLPDAGDAAMDRPSPASPASGEGAADFAPYHGCYLARQRDMGASIPPLRASVRAALARHSPALERLAALDAVLEQALAARERSLLATVPELLGRRFEALRETDPATPADAPARGGWLAAFRGEVQAVLLAELEVRLQPVAGLIAALERQSDAGRGLPGEAITAR